MTKLSDEARKFAVNYEPLMDSFAELGRSVREAAIRMRVAQRAGVHDEEVCISGRELAGLLKGELGMHRPDLGSEEIDRLAWELTRSVVNSSRKEK